MGLMLIQAQAQDPLFSQFYNNPVYHNPAYTGISPGMRARVVYREQWVNLPGNYQSYGAVVDFGEREIPGSGGFGLIATRDSEGDGFIENNCIGLSTSARVRLQDNILAQVGISGVYVQKSLDWSRLVFADQLNEKFGNVYPTAFVPGGTNQVSYPDLNVGGLVRWIGDTYSGNDVAGTIGFAMHHTTRPNESFIGATSPLPRKMVAHADVLWEQASGGRFYNKKMGIKRLKINPAMIFEKQGEFTQYTAGVNMMRSNLYLGLWYRNENMAEYNADAMIFMLGLNYIIAENTRMKIMYTYDIQLSDIRTATGPSHEITLSFELDDLRLFGGSNGVHMGPGSRYRDASPLECSPF